MSSLSARAARNVEFNESWTLLMKVWGNPYSEENPEGVVAMGVAENKLMHGEIVEYLNGKFQIYQKLLTYNDGPTGSVPLRNALSSFVNKNFSPHPDYVIKPEHVTVMSGVSACVDAICFCIANEGDGILLVRPAYVGFDGDLRDRAAVEPIWVSTGPHDVTGLEAVQDHENALLAAQKEGKTVKALLLCNPHNPLGRCYSKEVLEAYLKLCGKYKIHLISDEVYAKAVFPSKDIPDPLPFTSVLSLDIKKFVDPSFVHVLYGMSKDFSSNGLRIGAIISPSSPTLHSALSTVAKFSWSSSLSDHAWTLLLTDEKWLSWYFDTMTKKMTASYERCVDFLREMNVPYIAANCGPFIWLDLRGYMAEETIEAERKLVYSMIDHGVWIATGESFKSEVPGWFRITFAVPEEEFVFGCARLRKALEAAKSGLSSSKHAEGKDGDSTQAIGNKQEVVEAISEGVAKM